MLTQVLWWTSNSLITLLLLRAVRAGLFTKYPFFYFYLSYVLAVDLLRFYVYVANPGAYQVLWWYTQFLSVAVGYCVIGEIYTQGLANYAGAVRMARQVLLAAFVLIVAKFLAAVLSGTAWSQAETALERDLRAVQIILVVGILGLLVYYAIPVGRNLKGIILGYGFFLSTSIINLTLRSHLGDVFQVWWQYSQPMAYLVTLFVWSAALWSYQPNPKPEKQTKLDRDYEWLSTRTAEALVKARRHIMMGRAA